MDYSDELEAIFNRIDEGTCTERDRQILRERLLQADPALVSQLGKYNVSIAEGREVHIGDLITIEFNEQAMAQVIAALQTSGWRGDGGVYRDLEVLETVDLDSHLVERVNQRLKLLESLRDRARLSDAQKVELQEIQKQVRTVNTLNQELKSMSRRAKRLLQDVVDELSGKLQELQKATPTGLKEHPDNVNKLETLKEFLAGLKDGKQASQWVKQTSSQLKQTAGTRALAQFPEIRDRATQKELDAFDCSIAQFLEQVAHALEWGDYSILDAPEIPLAFDCTDCTSLYTAVFQHVKAILPRRSQPAEIIEQIEECLDYLLDSLARLY